MSKKDEWVLGTLPNIPVVRKVASGTGEAPRYEAVIRKGGEPPWEFICKLDFGYGGSNDETTARRIVACVNAMIGIEDPVAYMAELHAAHMKANSACRQLSAVFEGVDDMSALDSSHFKDNAGEIFDAAMKAREVVEKK